MKITWLIASIVNLAGWVVCYLFFTFWYRFSFNYEIDQTNQYYLIFTLPLTLFNIILYIFNGKTTTPIKYFCWIIITVLNCVLLFSNYYTFSNEYFFVLVSIFFITVGIALPSNKLCIYTILTLIFFVYIIQLYLGILQWWENCNDRNVSLVIKGSLENSGIYACYLAIHLPLLGFAKSHLLRKKNFKVFSPAIVIGFFLLIGINLLLIFQTQSRTALIALILTFSIVIFIKCRKQIKIWIKKIPKILLCFMVLALFCMIAGAICYLFYKKKLSAMGRLMKSEITLQHFFEQFLTGTGMGRFTWYYPQWQSSYFTGNPHPPKNYFLSAGECYIVFNEYLQLFKTVGLVGILVTFLLLFCFFKAKSVSNKSLVDALKIMMVIILSCGFTSYPLHVNSILLIVGFCFAAVFSLAENRIILYPYFLPKILFSMLPYSKAVFYTLVLSILLLTIVEGFKNFGAFQQWQLEKRSGSLQSVRGEIYQDLYNDLKTDGKFLSDYGAFFVENEFHIKQAISKLEEARNYHITRENTELLVEAYEKAGQYEKAIKLQNWLCNYLPNTFSTKHKLLKIYETINDYKNAHLVARDILMMHIKIRSIEVDFIRGEAMRVLKKRLK